MSASANTSPRSHVGPLRYAAAQVALGAWLVLWSRLLTGTGPNLAGALDDLSLVALFAAAQVLVAAFGKSRGARIAAGLPLLVLLAVFTFANVLFFRFFHTPIGVATFQLVGIAMDASSSLPKLVTPGSVFALLVLPITVQSALLAFGQPLPALVGGSRRRVLLPLLVGTLAFSSTAYATRQPVFLFVEQNPVMSLLRDAGSRTLRSFGADPLAGGLADLPFLLNRDGWQGYEFAGSAENPLLQRPRPGAAGSPDTSPRNVVLILMESMRDLEMQGSFRDVPVTPALNALEATSVVFERFYANGMTTIDGEFSTLCSALPVVNEAPVYIRKPALDIRCLPEILREAGYSTHWISAYKSNYANKRRFLRKHGIDQVHDKNSMSTARMEHPAVGWGMGDVDMFRQALEKIGGFPEPFFAEIMTLSNHHPFDHAYDLAFPEALASVPGNAHYRDYLRGMFYTDHAVGRFLAEARNEPWFSRTLFVILGDHAVRAFPNAPSGESLGPVLETEIYFRNRLILYGPGWLRPARNTTLGSQIDVAPTLLDVLGLQADNSFLGVSLLADLPHARRYALTSIGHVWNMRAGDQYCYSVGYSCFEGVFPRCAKGVTPTSLGHTCFAAHDDLLTHLDRNAAAGTDTVRDLDALERLRVTDRAERIMELNRRLIEEDRFR